MSNHGDRKRRPLPPCLSKELPPLPHVKELMKIDEYDKSSEGGVAALPATDRGKEAMLFLLSAFIIEATLWGFPLASAGVFQDFYIRQPQFRNNRYVAVIGTLGTGIPFLGAPLITPLTARWHKYQRQMIWTGWGICMISLVAASFSTEVWHLILTQGFGYGTGFLILYYAVLSMLNEWFVERRGLAYGILFAAAGISGTGIPFLIESTLARFGYAVTLRGTAVAILILVGPTLPFCRGRIPLSNQAQVSRKVAFQSVFTNPIFYILSISNLFQGMAFYLPGLYMKEFAGTLHVSNFKATLLLCFLNLSQVFGQVAFGWLSDRSDIFSLLLISTLGSAVPSCVLWYTTIGFKELVAFSVLYGIFAGSYSVFYPRFVSSMTSDPATALWLYGLLACGRGLGNVIAGPLSAEILNFFDQSDTFSPTPFRNLIVFVGGAFIISSFGALGYFWRDRRLMPDVWKSTIRQALTGKSIRNSAASSSA